MSARKLIRDWKPECWDCLLVPSSVSSDDWKQFKVAFYDCVVTNVERDPRLKQHWKSLIEFCLKLLMNQVQRQADFMEWIKYDVILEWLLRDAVEWDGTSARQRSIEKEQKADVKPLSLDSFPPLERLHIHKTVGDLIGAGGMPKVIPWKDEKKFKKELQTWSDDRSHIQQLWKGIESTLRKVEMNLKETLTNVQFVNHWSDSPHTTLMELKGSAKPASVFRSWYHHMKYHYKANMNNSNTLTVITQSAIVYLVCASVLEQGTKQKISDLDRAAIFQRVHAWARENKCITVSWGQFQTYFKELIPKTLPKP